MKKQLNITRGSDVFLAVRLFHRGEKLSLGDMQEIEAILLGRLGAVLTLACTVVDDYLSVFIPGDETRLPGNYSLQVRGRSAAGLAFSTVAGDAIRYTATTVGCIADEITTDGDVYDINLELGFMFGESPIKEVVATIDDQFGTPKVDALYSNRILSFAFHCLRGDGIKSWYQTQSSNRPGEANTFVIESDSGRKLTITLFNGTQGPKGDTVVLSENGEYTLYNLPGNNTDGAMTQAAVTEYVESRYRKVDSEEEMQEIIDNELFEQGVIYYTEEN